MSLYFDDELDSPWKEKFENHLENCASCRKHLETYRLTRQKLAGASLQMEQSLEKAMDRVWEKTDFTAKKQKRRFWTGSLTIPIPVAAAAGLAMAVALAALIALKQPVKTTEPQLAGMEMQEMIPVSDMASFFQHLGDDNSADMVIIRLPETTFKNVGESRMLRAADYTGGNGSR